MANKIRFRPFIWNNDDYWAELPEVVEFDNITMMKEWISIHLSSCYDIFSIYIEDIAVYDEETGWYNRLVNIAPRSINSTGRLGTVDLKEYIPDEFEPNKETERHVYKYYDREYITKVANERYGRYRPRTNTVDKSDNHHSMDTAEIEEGMGNKIISCENPNPNDKVVLLYHLFVLVNSRCINEMHPNDRIHLIHDRIIIDYISMDDFINDKFNHVYSRDVATEGYCTLVLFNAYTSSEFKNVSRTSGALDKHEFPHDHWWSDHFHVDINNITNLSYNLSTDYYIEGRNREKYSMTDIETIGKKNIEIFKDKILSLSPITNIDIGNNANLIEIIINDGGKEQRIVTKRSNVTINILEV